MAAKHDVQKNNEQTLLTLDQLSQTLDAMSMVVERLRKQVTRQAALNAELLHDAPERSARASGAEPGAGRERRKDAGEDERRFVVEISAEEMEDGIDPTVH